MYLCILLLVGEGYVEEGRGYQSGGVGAGKGARGVAHRMFDRLVVEDAPRLGYQEARREVVLLDDHRRASARKSEGGFGLVVAGGLGYRDEYGGDAPRRYFKNSACARARNNKVGRARRHARRKVIEITEGLVAREIRVVPHHYFGAPDDFVNMRGARLVDDLIFFEEPRQRGQHRLVDGLRALRAAGYQQDRDVAVELEILVRALARGHQCRFSDRVARMRYLFFREARRALGKGDRDLLGEAGGPAVDLARGGVAVEYDQGYAEELARQERGEARVPSGAEDDVRVKEEDAQDRPQDAPCGFKVVKKVEEGKVIAYLPRRCGDEGDVVGDKELAVVRLGCRIKKLRLYQPALARKVVDGLGNRDDGVKVPPPPPAGKKNFHTMVSSAWIQTV